MTTKQATKKLKKIAEDSRTDLEVAVVNELIDMLDGYNMAEDLWEDLSHGCSSGIVGSLIYYTDTHKFTKEHIEDILYLKEQLEQEIGEPIKTDGDILNWLAWFGFEETARKIGLEIGLEL